MNDGAMRPKGGEPAEAEWVERLRSLPRRWFGEGREVRPTQQAARLMLILVAGGLLLMSLADLFAPPGSREIAGTAGGARGEEPALRVEGARPEGATGEVEALEARLAGDLESALAQVRGAGEVTIRVTLAGGFVSRYATEERANRNRTEERDASGGTREVEESEEATTRPWPRPAPEARRRSRSSASAPR